MRRPLIAVVLALGVVAGSHIDLLACGDKFLLVGRGARYQAYAALYPATILVYARAPVSGKGTTVSNSRFAAALKQAGHRVRVVTTPSAAGEAIATGRIDIVLATLTDAIALEAQVGASAGAKLVPLLYEPSATELAAAVAQFDTVLKGPDRVTRFLAQIDDIVKARRPAVKATKG
jgi:hypothetical protein